MSLIDVAIPEILDRYIVPQVETHRLCRRDDGGSSRPFILGLTGLQGSGKSTWASKMAEILCRDYHYHAITVSLDDFYHDHAHLVAIASENSSNRLLQTRGQPGTHDEKLATQFFQSLECPASPAGNEDVLVPAFDKSAFGGEGDRASKELWHRIPQASKLDIVVFEGWCIGFRSLPPDKIVKKWKRANGSCKELPGLTAAPFRTVTLQNHRPEDLMLINRNLRHYCESFMGPSQFNYLVHLDTEKLQTVYKWRLEQEHALRAKGRGAMTDSAVQAFVEGYMPAYELYLDKLRTIFFESDQDSPNRSGACRKGHIRIILDSARTVKRIVQIL